MTEIVFVKGANCLVPADAQAAEYLAKLKMGAAITAKVKRHNNLAFHRKMFALFNLAFDAWEPEQKTYRGEVVQKNFDQFRKDLVVLAGFYDTVVNLKGDVRVVAKSLNFASMEQDEREQVYNAVINVVLTRILRSYTRQDLDRVIEQILGFA